MNQANETLELLSCKSCFQREGLDLDHVWTQKEAKYFGRVGDTCRNCRLNKIEVVAQFKVRSE